MKKTSKSKKMNKRGFSKIELLTMLGLIAVLLAIGAKLVMDNSKNYGAFKNLANNFAKDVANYKDRYTRPDNTYYLNDLIEKGYSEELKNPVKTSETCDKFESYVEIPETNNKKVTLKCGNYFVEGVQSEGYKVYKVSEWHDTKGETDNEEGVIYNYKVNDQIMLGEYVSSKAFIELYYIKTNSMILNPYDVNNFEGTELLIKSVYRTKELVKELK